MERFYYKDTNIISIFDRFQTQKMKKLLIVTLVLLAALQARAQDESLPLVRHYNIAYDDIKYDFDTRDYRYHSSDPYNPTVAGLASLFIPGFGQCLDGEWGRGIAFFFGQSSLAFVGSAAGLVLLSTIDYSTGAGKALFDIANPVFLATLGAQTILGIWNICDAVHVAKVKNLYYREEDEYASTLDLRLEPSFAMIPTGQGTLSPSAGVSLKLSF